MYAGSLVYMASVVPSTSIEQNLKLLIQILRRKFFVSICVPLDKIACRLIRILEPFPITSPQSYVINIKDLNMQSPHYLQSVYIVLLLRLVQDLG